MSTYSSDCEDHATKLPDKKELQVPDPHLLIAIGSFDKYDYVNVFNSIDGKLSPLDCDPWTVIFRPVDRFKVWQ